MKILKKIVILLILLTAVISFSAADQIDAFSEFPQALGGYYGEIGGQGLSYQRWFDRLGFQTAFGLWYSDEEMLDFKADSYSPNPVENIPFTYNVGFEVMYRVYKDAFKDWFDASLYVFGGLMHTGNFVNTYNYQQTPAADETYPYIGMTGPVYQPLFNPGIGIGFEVVLFNHFSLPLEFGLMGSWGLDGFMPVDAGLVVQGGLRYRY